MRRYCCPRTYFYPRPPRGGRQVRPVLLRVHRLFLSTPSARRATFVQSGYDLKVIEISIHALREEGDLGTVDDADFLKVFLSTPSARRATPRTTKQPLRPSNFYPRPPRGGRHRKPLRGVLCIQFLSTPSARRATASSEKERPNFFISIHALREEGDAAITMVFQFSCIFLSTPSARRATCDFGLVPVVFHFYPRPPRGGRQQKQRQNLYFQTNYTTFCTNLEEP